LINGKTSRLSIGIPRRSLWAKFHRLAYYCPECESARDAH
jgi:hypothetical protein